MNLSKKPNFFDRMMSEANKNGYSSVSELAKALKYSSTEKLYRLGRSEKNKPSFEIIEDLTNLFEFADLRYLITNKRSTTSTYTTEKANSLAAEKKVSYEKRESVEDIISNKILNTLEPFLNKIELQDAKMAELILKMGMIEEKVNH